MKKIFVLILLTIIVIAISVQSDTESYSYFIRVKLYSEGKMRTGYMRYFIEPFTSTYNSRIFDEDKFKGKKILYINRLVPGNWQDDSLVSTKDTLVIADTVCKVEYNKKNLFHYVVGKKIDVKTIDAVEADSLLWNNETYQEIWVDSLFAEMFRNKKVIFQDTMFAECEGYHSVNIISFDTFWTKERFNKLFKRAPFGSDCDFNFSLDLFNSEIQKAIRERKLFVFEKRSL